MPPAISEDESSGSEVPDDIPAKPVTKAKAKAAPAPVEEPAVDDDQGDSEQGEDEYVVEAVLDHRGTGKNLKYQVKWLGYEDEADVTWEPLENLDTAPDKLQEYHDRIARPPTASKSKAKPSTKRSASDALDSPAPTSARKKGRKSVANGDDALNEIVLPKGTWENDLSNIISIVEEVVPNARPGKEQQVLMGFVEWNNGNKSKHPIATLRTKAPQHLLTYYENHLVFPKKSDQHDVQGG